MEKQQSKIEVNQLSEEDFILIVDEYKKKIINLCYSYTRDYYEAEDLSQEVFVSLYKNLKKFRFESSISTYIYKITLSKCMDYGRKSKVKKFFVNIFNLQEKSHEDSVLEKNYVRESIDKLPEKYKTPIYLYFYIGLNQKEIASVMGISEKNVEGRIYRAKKKLKIEFQKEEDDYEKKYRFNR
ncbi:RNA polymerase sigma factor [Haloimpatiens sp. FM7315]|uniref:RNA polymerase sigma factor n=1 Tax=Haloimpatiens sp. FM7315 TaxID=3298609 RepID=UPI00370CE971